MAYCVVIGADLNTDTCPLESGRCFYQHRKTHACMSRLAKTKNLRRLAKGVGLTPLTKAEVDELTRDIREAIKS